MRVCLHGPSGEFTIEEQVDFRIDLPLRYRGRMYEYAGTQDGAHHYGEKVNPYVGDPEDAKDWFE
jgi:hypothetical protein